MNYEVELDLSWTKYCVSIEHHTSLTRVYFVITGTKCYVLAVTLSIKDNIKFLENLEQEFKRILSWNKYRFEITTQPKKNI